MHNKKMEVIHMLLGRTMPQDLPQWAVELAWDGPDFTDELEKLEKYKRKGSVPVSLYSKTADRLWIGIRSALGLRSIKKAQVGCKLLLDAKVSQVDPLVMLPAWLETIEQGKMIVLPQDTPAALVTYLQHAYKQYDSAEGRGGKRTVRISRSEEDKPTHELPQGWGVLRKDVTKENIIALLEFVGANKSDKGDLWDYYGLRINLRQDESWAIQERFRIGSFFNLYGMTITEGHTAMYAFLSGVVGAALSEGFEQSTYTGQRNAMRVFSTLDLNEALNLDTTEWVFPARKNMEDMKLGVLSFTWSETGFRAETNQLRDELDIASTVSKLLPGILLEPQLKWMLPSAEILGGRTVIEEDGRMRIYLPVQDLTKKAKRLGVGICKAVEPSNPTTSSLRIAGYEVSGVKVKAVVARNLLPIFAGGLGGIADLLPQALSSKLWSHPIDVTKRFFIIDVTDDNEDECNNALPKKGDIFEEGDILFTWMNKNYKVDHEDTGEVTSVDLLRTFNDEATVVIGLRRIDTHAQIKPRSFNIKGQTCRPGKVLIAEEASLEVISEHNLTLLGYGLEGVEILLTMDSIKSTGKGSSIGVMSLACNTLDIKIDFDAKAQFEELYDAIVEKFEKVARRIITVGRVISPREAEILLKTYKLDWADAQDDQLTHNLSKTDVLTIAKVDETWVVTQVTEAFIAYDIVEIESAPISVMVTQTSSMLEVGLHAFAAGRVGLAKSLNQGGMRAAYSLEALYQLTYGVKVQRVRESGAVVDEIPLAQATMDDTWKYWGEVRKDIPVVISEFTVGQLRDELQAEDPGISEAAMTNIQRLQEWSRQDPKDWPENHTFVCRSTRTGAVVAFNRTTMRDFGVGTRSGGIANTACGILACCAKLDYRTAERLIDNFAAQAVGLLDSGNVNKRFFKGARCIGAKRIPVFCTKNEDHKAVFLNPDGEVAKRLARLFHCSVGSLKGCKVLGYRAPLFMGAPLTIKFDRRVGPHMIGLSHLVAALDHGDFDGDYYYIIPVWAPDALAEMDYDPFEEAEAVRLKCSKKASVWEQTDVWEAAKSAWAKPMAPYWEDTEDPEGKHIKGVRTTDLEACRHQKRIMPGNAMKAWHGLFQATLGIHKVDLVTGMLPFVYEEQLSGYREVDVVLDDLQEKLGEYKELSYSKRKELFLELVTGEKLGLKPALASFWFNKTRDRKAYRNAERAAQRPPVDGYNRIPVPVSTSSKGEELDEACVNIMGGMAKRLAQGSTASSLLRNLHSIVLTPVDKDGVAVLGLGEVLVWSAILERPDDGNPAILRLKFFGERILPLLKQYGITPAEGESEEETQD